MTSKTQKILPVILSGGSGTRLWPSSRADRPKQFLPIIGGHSTFEAALNRIGEADLFLSPMVVTASRFAFMVAEELRRANVAARIVLEPMRRDSAAAIAIAAHLATELQPDALLLTLAADHIVKDKPAFLGAIRAGRAAALDGRIVTFGITPDAPATAYGYIEPGAAVDDGIFEVRRFIEKPDETKAGQLIDNDCLWNSGNFLFRADVLLGELAAFEPDIHAAAIAAARGRHIETVGSITLETVDAEQFAMAPAKSIDFAVMERTRLAAVVPANCGWSDVGTWNALWNVLPKDAEGNVANGPVMLSGTRNSFISSDSIHTAVIGINGLAIIATQDAVLVAPRETADELKAMVAKLEALHPTRSLTERHKVSLQSWGSEQAVFDEGQARVRILRLRPNEKVMIEGNTRRSVRLVVVRGNGIVRLEAREHAVQAGSTLLIPQAENWQVINHEAELELVEIGIVLDAESRHEPIEPAGLTQ